MLASKILSRVSSTVGRRTPLLSSHTHTQKPQLHNHFHSLFAQSPNNLAPSQLPQPHRSVVIPTISQLFGFSSAASPETSQKENNAGSTNDEATKTAGDATESGQVNDSDPAAKETKESGSNSESQFVNRRRRGTKQTAFSDSDSDAETDLSLDDLKKLVFEKEELLKLKHDEIEKMQDKMLRAYADMENVMDRTKRNAENSKKFAIQSFAKGLLDVADNLGRASSVVKESFSKLDTSNDSAGAVPLLKTLLEGVEMTEKQLAEVFRKFGVEKYDPINEPFDPNRHNAMFQVPDGSKPPGTIAHVLKAGYMLHDRVIRPAEVGVTQEVEQDSS